MKDVLLVFAGGGMGSVLRYLTGKLYKNAPITFPLATLTANFLSCIIFGLIVAISTDKLSISNGTRALLLTGFCGGFSTYSSFTFETVELLKAGQLTTGFLNIALNFILSVFGLYTGALLARLL